ncbi:O-antigen ligase family protein [Candidatus Thiothrix anitrata]|uniref:O-antigen ligase family protein n=1 Tax=Candidatus Thiothrix anitrata TaxID=2823902 RepID=A0ABX7X6R9_9GAMM|nr:O-antigen ligase family protein [Candidatus Thiothrix anitrata]QTR51132.1 O-antigen ligase family protein [Candidatus Thiothrix anitrata]
MLTTTRKNGAMFAWFKNQHWLAASLLIIVSILPFFMTGAFHDSQRLITIIALGILISYQLMHHQKQPKVLLISLLLLLLWGSVLTLNSLSIAWSLIELLLFATLAIGIVTTHYSDHHKTLRLLAGVFALCQAIYLLRALLNYSFILIHQDILDVWNVIDGFSNIRFYAQFLSWTLPFILAYIIIHQQDKLYPWLLAAVIASWVLVLISGTRAFLFGIAFSMIAVMWFTPSLWRSYAKAVVMTGLSGVLGYVILIFLMPMLFGLDNSAALNSTVNRDFTNSSGRVQIWLDTLSIIVTHPFMGIGPMMTAMEGVLDKVAHPHNFPLQLAAEWGIPFASVVLLCITYMGWRWRNIIKAQPSEREALAFPIVAAISSAMGTGLVDGILVMPVSLFYMTIITGLAFSLWCSWVKTSDWLTPPKIAYRTLMIIPLALIIITASQWQHLSDNPSPHQLEPRFWADGKIRLPTNNP